MIAIFYLNHWIGRVQVSLSKHQPKKSLSHVVGAREDDMWLAGLSFMLAHSEEQGHAPIPGG
jgi:hypothetical protein